MSAPAQFGGPVLAGLAWSRKLSLFDAPSKCAAPVALGGAASVWDMDRGDIRRAAEQARSKRCDYAVHQGENPLDGRSHVALVECKRQLRAGRKTLLGIRNQFVGGLKVLRGLAGAEHFAFDELTPVLVYSRAYSGAVAPRLQREEYLVPHPGNGRRVRIRTLQSGGAIDDAFVAVKNGRRKG